MSDLSVAGPGSPVSLQKFLDTHEVAKPFSVLIDGTGGGIAKDAAEVIYITPKDCSEQAIYFSKNVFDGRIPDYLYRYLAFMMLDREYQTQYELVADMNAGKVTTESEDYKHIQNLIKYCDSNPEAQQVIGLIQLIAGIFNMAKKAKAGIRVYLEHPETALHPKRQARFVSMFMHLKEEYGSTELEEENED